MTAAPARIARRFLGWDRPLLQTAVEWLRTEGPLGPDGAPREEFLLVVPGRRAARRLLEALAVELAGPRFEPPRILTPGELLEGPGTADLAPASALESLLAWDAALGQSRAEDLEPLVGRSALDLTSRSALGRELDAVSRELWLADVGLAQVAAMLRNSEHPLEAERWHALRLLEARHARVLESSGLASTWNAPDPERDLGALVLLGISELPPRLRRLVRTSTHSVDVLIQAPADREDGFDELGCPRTDVWSECALDYRGARMETMEGPQEMVARLAASLPEDASGVTVGVTDPSLLATLETELVLRHIDAHSPIGRAFAASRPALALQTLGAYLRTRSLEDLGAVLRCPDLEEAVLRASPALQDRDLLSELDEFTTRSLARGLETNLQSSPSWLSEVDRLLEALLPLPPSGLLSEWAPAVAEAMVALYGAKPLDLDTTDDAELAAALERVGETLAQMQRVPEELDRSVPLRHVLRLLQQVAGATALPTSSADPRGVEILGWLELALDDAEEVLVLGVNEGQVPQAVREDVLLPNGLRRRLGLTDDRSRLARDAFHLQTLMCSRRRVRLLSALRGGDDEPLLPSRLLLRVEESELPHRLDAWYDITPAPDAPARAPETVPPPPVPALEAPEVPASLPVTAFRDYLACPFRFFLRHVLRLRTSRDRPREIEAAGFGTLAHEVLRRFARGPLVAETRVEIVEAALLDELEQLVHTSLAADVGPAVRVQLAQLRRRLSAFAAWQAEQTSAGWQILPEVSEADLAGQLLVDGEPFGVRGRIDRIDRHPVHGTRLLDYKTSDSPRSPRLAHLRAGEWTDLQLPLYVLLASQNGLVPRETGYVQLSKKRDLPDLLALASWTGDELDDAWATAEEVVRRLRAWQFAPSGDVPQFADGLELLAGDRLPQHLREEWSKRVLETAGCAP